MKKSPTVIDFDKDLAYMFGEEQPLVKTTSRHYKIRISKERRMVEFCCLHNERTGQMQC